MDFQLFLVFYLLFKLLLISNLICFENLVDSERFLFDYALLEWASIVVFFS